MRGPDLALNVRLLAKQRREGIAFMESAIPQQNGSRLPLWEFCFEKKHRRRIARCEITSQEGGRCSGHNDV
ncbi:hypothetical protein chiPu_0005777 [Chiloscyllium punctatum]|uniref:Uncharacterized protein n=1 Tax=Chiloscyllium punctatum TaxID=137246 RepID=A0A401SAF2_CHIPU|nr:hypothetical protein [Chiloscyllium punctatum]